MRAFCYPRTMTPTRTTQKLHRTRKTGTLGLVPKNLLPPDNIARSATRSECPAPLPPYIQTHLRNFGSRLATTDRVRHT
jgi:hypothetical protein